MILDPANPTVNVCALDWPLYNVWHYVGDIAQKTIDQSKLLADVKVKGRWQQ